MQFLTPMTVGSVLPRPGRFHPSFFVFPFQKREGMVDLREQIHLTPELIAGFIVGYLKPNELNLTWEHLDR